MYLNKVLLFLALVTLALTSCTGLASDDNAHQIAEKYISETSADDYQPAVFDWLSVDTEYTSASDDNSEGIIRLADSYLKNKNRLFFTVSHDHSSSVWAYTDLNTGETLNICPDPLCKHTRESGCKYLDMRDIIFDSDSCSKLYAVKNLFQNGTIFDVICFVDIENNEITELYRPAVKENEYIHLDLLYQSKDSLIFINTLTRKEKSASGEIQRISETSLLSLDIGSHHYSKITNELNSLNYEQFMFASDKYLYFFDETNGCLYVTDLNFNNKKTVLNVGNDNSIRNISYDTDTNELFIAICSNFIAGLSNYAEKREEGYLYCIDDENLECTKVDMPTDKLLYAQPTKNYIYYTEYLPIDYGPGRLGRCIDPSGNKLFRVSRGDTNKSELVFDGRSELFFTISFFADGNYIYLDYSKLEQDEVMTFFRSMGVTARVNFKNNTIKWID